MQSLKKKCCVAVMYNFCCEHCCKMQSLKKECCMMQGSDSDDSTVGDNEQRQAGMLLVGPVGSGKTSLVYTAAQVTK